MSNRIKSYIGIGLLVLTAAISIFGLTLMCLFFGYLNQSSLKPETERLDFYNHLLPFFITLVLITYFVVRLIATRTIKGRKPHWFVLVLIVVLAAIALPWQIQQIEWLIEKVKANGKVDTFEWISVLTGMAFTIGSVVIEIRSKKLNSTLTH